MALTKIEFDNPVNTSLLVGDEVYISSIETTGPAIASFNGSISEPQHAAKVLGVGLDYVIIDIDITTPPMVDLALNPSGYYILFAKNIVVNESSLKGYQADVTFENSSNTKTELFGISSEVALSSKQQIESVTIQL